MAIQINGTTVISNVPNIVNVNNANFTGIVTTATLAVSGEMYVKQRPLTSIVNASSIVFGL